MIDISQFEQRSVAFHTLGCKLNFAETSSIGRELAAQGFRKIKQGEQADICVINTCSVTDMADKKSRQAITRLIRKYPKAFIVVTGCYAQLKPEEISQIKGVDLVLGAKEKFDLTLYFSSKEKKEKAQIHNTKINEIREFQPSCSRDDRTRFFLKVQDGCDYYCTYCTIPFARGHSRSASIADTVIAAQKAVAEGAKEIVLAGVNTGDFGRNTGETFLQLITALDKIEGVERYRISSIEPNLLNDEIIHFVTQSKRFAPHFHIPLQSGSNDVLALMKRRYNRELFAEKIATIKQVMPHAFIGVDIIVGTRGETKEFFEDARQFIENLDISQLHIFSYSERVGTKALEINHTVTPQEKKQRSEILHHISEKKTQDFYRSQIGREVKVLWESSEQKKTMHGFSENYIRLSAPYNEKAINQIQSIVIKEENLTF